MNKAPDRVAVPRGSVARSRAFRRLRADRVVGVFGILLLVGSTFLFFSWQKPTPQPFGFNVVWQETEAAMELEPLTLTEGTGLGPAMTPDRSWANQSLVVPGPNVTRLEVNAFFQDDIGEGPGHGDRLNATLFAPPDMRPMGTQEGIATRSQGKNISFLFALNLLPNVVEAPKGSLPEAQAFVTNQTTSTWSGNWSLRLHLEANGYEYSGPGAEPPQFICNDVTEGAGQCRQDRANEVRVTFRWFAYHAQFEPKH